MENLLGPQDGGRAIQQNNGLAWTPLVSAASAYEALGSEPALLICCRCRVRRCASAVHIDHLLSSAPSNSALRLSPPPRCTGSTI